MDQESPIEDALHEEMVREVFARFGLAYYEGECVHRQLGILYALLPYAVHGGGTRPRIEERLREAWSATMGGAATLVFPLLGDESLACELKACVASRNFLAHSFWYERSHLMASPDGLSEMVAELGTVAQRLRDLDERLTDVGNSAIARMNLPPGAFEQAIRDAETMPPDTLPDRRYPRARERIVKAWTVTLEREWGPILESEDGELWQLTDVGLGWSYWNRQEGVWASCGALERHLPADIVSRPKGARPWDYSLHLSTGVLLRVRLGTGSHHYRWTVESARKERGQDAAQAQ